MAKHSGLKTEVDQGFRVVKQSDSADEATLQDLAVEDDVLSAKEIFDHIQVLRAVGCECPAWQSGTESGLAQRYARNSKKQVYDQRLATAAAKHSKDMAFTLKRMSHTGSDGSDFIQRMNAAGYRGNSWGENVAFNSGNKDAYQTVVNWQNSKSGHCNSMMDPDYKSAGYGYAARGNNHYWTGNLGA